MMEEAVRVEEEVASNKAGRVLNWPCNCKVHQSRSQIVCLHVQWQEQDGSCRRLWGHFALPVCPSWTLWLCPPGLALQLRRLAAAQAACCAVSPSTPQLFLLTFSFYFTSLTSLMDSALGKPDLKHSCEVGREFPQVFITFSDHLM